MHDVTTCASSRVRLHALRLGEWCRPAAAAARRGGGGGAQRTLRPSLAPASRMRDDENDENAEDVLACTRSCCSRASERRRAAQPAGVRARVNVWKPRARASTVHVRANPAKGTKARRPSSGQACVHVHLTSSARHRSRPPPAPLQRTR
jgi:hypothetical protein